MLEGQLETYMIKALNSGSLQDLIQYSYLGCEKGKIIMNYLPILVNLFFHGSKFEVY